MGGAFGVAILSALLLGRLPHGDLTHGAAADPAAAAQAFSLVFLAAAGFAALCLVAALRLKEIPLRGRD
jgi:hypothetical protein